MEECKEPIPILRTGTSYATTKSVRFLLPDNVMIPERRRSDHDFRHSQLDKQLHQTARRFGERRYRRLHLAVKEAICGQPVILTISSEDGQEQDVIYWPCDESIGTEFLYWLELLRRAGEQWPSSSMFTTQHVTMIQAALNPEMESSKALFRRLFDRDSVGQFRLRSVMGLVEPQQWSSPSSSSSLYQQQCLDHVEY